MPFSTTRSYASNPRVKIGPKAGSVTTSDIVIQREPKRIQSVRVAVDVQHAWPGDLEIQLIDPNQRSVTLVDRVPTSTRGVWAFNNTRFEDGAASLASGTIPFVGRFDPVGSLATFQSGRAEGVWTLRVRDRSEDNDGGELLRWALSITYEAAQLEIDWAMLRSVRNRLAQASAAVRAFRYLRCVQVSGGLQDPKAHIHCMKPGGPVIVPPTPGDPVDPPIDLPLFEEHLMRKLPEEAQFAFGEALMASTNELLEETLEALEDERALARMDPREPGVDPS